jgi:hypothetical protein
LVAAIESLASSDASSPVCGTCGRPRDEPTRRFKDFLEKYSPGAGNRSSIDRLYKMRSSLVHGTSMLRADDSPSWAFTPDRLDEHADLDRLHQAVRVSLVNWLREAAREAAVTTPG